MKPISCFVAGAALALVPFAALAQYPRVSRVAESGFPGFEAVSWFGLFAPAD